MEQIRNPGIRLKKRVTVEKGVDPKGGKTEGGEGGAPGAKSGPGGGLSMVKKKKNY